MKLPAMSRISVIAALLSTGLSVMAAPQAPAPPQTPSTQRPDFVVRSMAGRDLFEFYCASCHGRDGKGGGRAAPALKVAPPDLTTLTERNHGVFPSERVGALIKGEGQLSTPAHGSSDMPVWGPIFKGLDSRDAVNAARIEAIVKHIDSLQVRSKAMATNGRRY